MIRRSLLRWVVGAVGALLVLVGTAAPAAADPPRPTNYRSTVTDVTPALPRGAEVRIIGGDSLLELSLPVGHTAIVADYAATDDDDPVPYLRFRADGTVERNALAIATTANESRYGSSDRVPDPDADPEWETVATGGTYAWHDHRIHWMSPTAPRAVDDDGRVDLGGEDGTWSVPITIDDTPTVITGDLVLESPPPAASTFALVIGALALVAAVVVLADRFGPRGTGALAAVVGLLAVLTAWATWQAVPADAGGSIVPVAVAAVAVVAGLVVLAGPANVRVPALAAASASLLGWGVLRFSVLTHAVLPTTLDPWIDRAATAAAIGVGAGIAVLLVRGPKRRPAPAAGVATASPTA